MATSYSFNNSPTALIIQYSSPVATSSGFIPLTVLIQCIVVLGPIHDHHHYDPKRRESINFVVLYLQPLWFPELSITTRFYIRPFS